jgi:hypothetical protein
LTMNCGYSELEADNFQVGGGSVGRRNSAQAEG